jgi:glycosyltransferase involved in cell wall biosynthesis
VVRVSIAEDVPEDVARLCATLPRVQVLREAAISEGAQPDWRVIEGASALISRQPASVRRLFCDNLDASSAMAIRERLASEGFAAVDGTAAIFVRSEASAPAAMSTVQDLAPLAPERGKRGIVLLYSDEPNPHGVAHYNHALLLALVRAGWTVCTAHPRFESPLIEIQQAAGIRHYWTTWNWGQRFINSMVDCAEPERILAAVQPDLVVFSDCWPISNIAAKHMVIKRDLPYLVVCHSGDLAPGQTFPASLKVAAGQFARAREVVAVAGSSLKVLREHYGLPADKGRVIWNGRPASYFAPSDPAASARLRHQLGLPAEAILCFTAARFDALKGYQYQLEAIKQLVAKSRNLPVYFAWAGTGHLQEEFQAAIIKQGLQERIRLLGYQDNIAEWLGAADVFILTTMLEAMPLSVLEAMAKGTPVIATAVGGIPEELGETGKLLPDPNVDPAGTVQQLVDTLRAWTADPALRKKIGLAGKQRAERFFREETTIEKTLALIDEISIAAPQATAALVATAVA